MAAQELNEYEIEHKAQLRAIGPECASRIIALNMQLEVEKQAAFVAEEIR